MFTSKSKQLQSIPLSAYYKPTTHQTTQLLRFDWLRKTKHAHIEAGATDETILRRGYK